MIKRTLCFTSPAYLSLKDFQMVVRLPEVEKSDMPESLKRDSIRTIPVEDIGVVVLDNRQITITHGLLEALLENNCAVVTCDARGMPVGLMLPLCGNTVQSERFRLQTDASLPLKKQLWQQTVRAKIANQAAVLRSLTDADTGCMTRWIDDVRSGDADNLEAVPPLIIGRCCLLLSPDSSLSPVVAMVCRPTICSITGMRYFVPWLRGRWCRAVCCPLSAYTITTATMPIVWPTT